jgi:hypothetical protein
MIGGLVLSCIAWPACLRAQPPTDDEDAEPTATMVRPVRVDVLSLQVSKLPRHQFGHGIKPGTNETTGGWLAGSGTALDLRMKVDRPIRRFQEPASHLVRFADDKDGDLTRSPDGQEINTFFTDNKPILVKLGPAADEAEVILRGYGTPAPGATRLRVHADLVFLSATGERNADRKGLEGTPGTSAMIGPLRIHFKDPRDAPPPQPPAMIEAQPPAMIEALRNHLKDLRDVPPPQPDMRFGPFARRPPAPVDQPGRRRIAFDYERFDGPIKSLVCLDPEGQSLAKLDGSTLSHATGGTVLFGIPDVPRVTLRVVSFEKSETITVPIRLETGVGF